MDQIGQSVSGIFAQMRQTRAAALNEEKDEERKEDDLSEEYGGTEEDDLNEEEVEEPELNEAMKKVVRDGEVVTKKISTKKKRLTAAQKSALAKARKKAHTAGAEKARKKSNKVGRSRGLHEEATIECPECGFEGTEEDFDEEDGVLYCPECGAEIETENESNNGCRKKKTSKKNEEVDVAELAARLDECGASEYMVNALNEGKYDLVQRYLTIKEGD